METKWEKDSWNAARKDVGEYCLVVNESEKIFSAEANHGQTHIHFNRGRLLTLEEAKVAAEELLVLLRTYESHIQQIETQRNFKS